MFVVVLGAHHCPLNGIDEAVGLFAHPCKNTKYNRALLQGQIPPRDLCLKAKKKKGFFGLYKGLVAAGTPFGSEHAVLSARPWSGGAQRWNPAEQVLRGL